MTLTLSDGSGTTVEDSLDAIITNAAPVIAPKPNQHTQEGSTFALVLDFTDASPVDTHSATINWGDGSPTEDATIIEVTGAGQVLGGHAYADNGEYQVTVLLSDDDNASTPFTFTVVVANVAPTAELAPKEA